ncbi:hypothetical protein F5146DRAFT_998011 [Armillaria mellea]|nr:hypothetical protein F5146DRAFT_998011 [Armillaria mellea]
MVPIGCDDLRWDDKTNADKYNGNWLFSGFVRGLAVGDPEGQLRRGELIVRDRRGGVGVIAGGKCHTIQIVATHQYPIPEGSYALLASRGLQWRTVEGHWAVGNIRPRGIGDWIFEKISVFEIPDENEMERLNNLRIVKWSCVTLI